MAETKVIQHASIYDGLCSTIGNTMKLLFADDATLPTHAEFSRITVKVRSLGTNAYIAIGTTIRNLRFTAAGQSMTFIAPVIDGSTVPLKGQSLSIIGDSAVGATGVLEISAIRVYRESMQV